MAAESSKLASHPSATWPASATLWNVIMACKNHMPSCLRCMPQNSRPTVESVPGRGGCAQVPHPPCGRQHCRGMYSGGIMSRLIFATCARRLGRVAQTEVAQICDKKNCCGNSAENRPWQTGKWFLSVGPWNHPVTGISAKALLACCA